MRVPDSPGLGNRAGEDKPVRAVSVLMPVRNEADFVERSLSAVLSQDYPQEKLEILVIDGMSTDGTRGIVESVADRQTSPVVKLIDNPGKIVSTGLNVGLEHALGEVIVRVDGHCEIEKGYLLACVDRLSVAGSTLRAVGGSIETIGSTLFGEAAAAAMSSRFGVGGSTFRVGAERDRSVDTVPFPAYTRATLEAAGPFDEELVRNQDDEHNFRIRSLEGSVLLSPSVRSRYHARTSWTRLWRQYFQYGLWKVRVLQKHPRQMSARQFAPPFFVAALLAGGILWALRSDWWWPLALIAGSYAAANLVATVAVSLGRGLRFLPLLPVVYATLHLSYGLGFLVGLLKFWNRWGDKTTLVNGCRLLPGEWLQGTSSD